MPVPSAFNEMTSDIELRDYFGAAWYFTTFDAPAFALPPNLNSRIAHLCDFIVWNRYFAWYENHGHLEDIEPQLRADAQAWRNAFPDKPLMLAEFGADAVAGFHSDPPVTFSEEYQAETIRIFCETTDTLPYIVGEHVWNLCDFMTKQGLTRVMGNRKGVHTRDREPKLAAHYLRQRWKNASSAP